MQSTNSSLLVALVCLCICSLGVQSKQDPCAVRFFKSPDHSTFRLLSGENTSTVYVNPKDQSWKAYINNGGEKFSIDFESNEQLDEEEPLGSQRRSEGGIMLQYNRPYGLQKVSTLRGDSFVNQDFRLQNPPIYAKDLQWVLATAHDFIVLDAQPDMIFQHLFLQEGQILTLVRSDCSVETYHLNVATPQVRAFVKEMIPNMRLTRG